MYRLVSQANSGALYDAELAQTTIVHDGTLLNIDVHEDTKHSATTTSPPPSELPKRPNYLPELINVTNTSQTFSVSFHTIGGPFSFGPPFPSHLINGKAFSGDENDFAANLTLGTLQDWHVGIEGDSDTGAGNHPYHQHVNPFQVVDMGAGLDEYLGIRVGEYRDTIPLTPTAQYRIRFVPDRFDGRALVHCHMVPHIDLGMAAVVSINNKSNSSSSSSSSSSC